MMDYSKILSGKVQSLQPSGIRKFFDLLADRPEAISLSIGEPDFQTPWHIREAGIKSLEDGFTKYSSNAGMTALRKEISRYLERRFGLGNYDPETQILVTVGGSEAIDLAIRALLNDGEELLVPEPSFVCYGPMATMAGGKGVPLPLVADNEFRISPEQLEAAITPKTKALILPYPSNPTGGIMTREDLEALAPVIIKHNLMVISDEIYAELNYYGKHCSIASIPGMEERTVLVNGFSKAYSMTGWRLGYACAPEPVMRQIMKIHQYAIMCAPTTSQYAGIEALKNGDEDIERMKEEYDGRRRFLLQGLRDLGLDCFEPRGAFYMFPCIRSTGLDSAAFCERLLTEQDVACVPGSAFGASGEGFIRMSYAASMENLTEAVNRIDKLLKTL